ncbi:MAG: acyl-CoA dehydrogenase family protein [Actinomycetota bacterium]|jgi:alkylation response protein AidB-like acyl-CoA dehydrogenase|nr:acyl-CoA dehydrogenase family protein [Actinomycetota bacterium]
MTDAVAPETDESAQLAGFRARCAAFLDEHATGEGLNDPDPRGAVGLGIAKAFQAKVFEARLAGATIDSKYGGMGLDSDHEKVWREEAAKHPIMTAQLAISHGMCMPMLNEYGTDQQKDMYLSKVLSAEEVWCQMFSEPGAGSDVASLQMRAVRDGDEWILNGQKVWTTLAHLCDRGLIVARTDPSAVKHAGISMFIVDMTAPGVEIRPINQIDGGQRFNEIFFTDVRVPADHLVPPENDGWRLATAMLMYERVAIGTGMGQGVQHQRADILVGQARKRGVEGDAGIRQELMRLYSAEVCQSLVGMITRARLQAGQTPGPGGSLGKLAGANIGEMYRDLSLRIQGQGSMAWDTDGDGSKWALGALSTLSGKIAGGTNEIQKNIIGDRVLGLPREPAVDRGVPFSELKAGSA